jgi:hypothetical protein
MYCRRSESPSLSVSCTSGKGRTPRNDNADRSNPSRPDPFIRERIILRFWNGRTRLLACQQREHKCLDSSSFHETWLAVDLEL